MRRFVLHWGVGLGVLTLSACGSSSDSPESGGAAGMSPDAAGGTSAAGGSSGSGGFAGIGSGGTSATGGAAGASGGAAGAAGVTGSGGTAATGSGGTGATGGSAGGGPCVPATCQGKLYQCGDCADNDNDGKSDAGDSDCFGPCDNNETGWKGNIPGQAAPPCMQDCYFDQDSGSGNDQCYWDHRCDPREKAPNYPPEGMGCAYDADTKVQSGGPPWTCAQARTSQKQECKDFCGPLVPNGCDCFGCCNVPGVNHPIWLGSTDANGAGSCDLSVKNDALKCKPCTIVAGCFNDCKTCELCLGKTTIPASCTGSGGTGGSGGSGGAGGSGGSSGGAGGSGGSTGGSGGTGGSCPTPECPVGVQPCGLSCLPSCTSGTYCVSGCCQFVP